MVGEAVVGEAVVVVGGTLLHTLFIMVLVLGLFRPRRETPRLYLQVLASFNVINLHRIMRILS